MLCASPEACRDLRGKFCLVHGLWRVNKTQRYSGREPCVRLEQRLAPSIIGRYILRPERRSG